MPCIEEASVLSPIIKPHSWETWRLPIILAWSGCYPGDMKSGRAGLHESWQPGTGSMCGSNNIVHAACIHPSEIAHSYICMQLMLLYWLIQGGQVKVASRNATHWDRIALNLLKHKSRFNWNFDIFFYIYYLDMFSWNSTKFLKITEVNKCCQL